MKTILMETQPNNINYVYVYDLLEKWKQELEKLEEELNLLMLEFQYNNYKLRKYFAEHNIKELGEDIILDLDFETVKTPYMQQLVKSSITKLDADMESMILAMLMSESTEELLAFVDNEKVAEQSTGELMRVYRTENTQMRSDLVDLTIAVLYTKGVTVKRQWVHTLSNPNVSVSRGYTPRKDHQALDGVLEDENGEFTTPSGNTTKAPGEFGLPSEDINCRCDVVFVSV